MENDKLSSLVLRLHARTTEGKIEWEKTSAANAFLASFSNYSIQLSEEDSFDTPEMDYRIAIFDSEGNRVDSFTDNDLANVWPKNQPHQVRNPYIALSQIYRSARRIALGADKAINEIIEELDDEFPF